MRRPGYMSIREAAARYEVSRAKIHRLVQTGRLRTSHDPRDERVTLLRAEDLETLFRFPRYQVADMQYETDTASIEATAGRLTAAKRARIDALRMRAAGGRRLTTDSASIIREEREKHSRQLYRAAIGATGKKRPNNQA